MTPLTAQSAVEIKDAALSAVEVRDSVLEMPHATGKARGRRIPCPDWWFSECEAQRKLAGLTHRELTELWARDLRSKRGLEWWEDPEWEATEMQVLRCLTGAVPTLEAVTALSRILRVPNPFVVAETRTEAVTIGRTRDDFRADIAIVTRTPAAQLVAAVLGGQGQSPQEGDSDAPRRAKRPTEASVRRRRATK